MSDDNNENWGKCPKCGSPVLINPDTSEAEACSNCASAASKGGIYGGTLGIVIDLAVVALVVYLCIRLLLD
jgi:uncharacterized protein (DUF983 family)